MFFSNFLNNFLLKPNYIFSIISTFLLSIIYFSTIFYFRKNVEKTNYSTIKKCLYIFLNSSVFALSTIFINSIFAQLVIIVISTLTFTFIFKEPFIKFLIYSLIFTIILFNIELVVMKIASHFSNYIYSGALKVPLFILVMFFSYFTSLVISRIIISKLKINSIEISNSFKNSIEISIIYLIDLFLAFQFLDVFLNYVTINNYYIILCFFLLINFYYCISISNILKTLELEASNKKILNLELHNKSISAAYDQTRTFKHDSNNIFQAIGGYLSTNNLEGLKEYYWQLFPEIKNINDLSKLNPTLINNPAIYGLLVEKHFKAHDYNVNINLDIMMDLNTLNVKIFELTRILGILVDNAIETAKDCSEKIVNISFRKDDSKQLLIVENTYENKDICIDKIFEKGYSTKPNNTGLGLWEVRKILNKNTNLNLYTSKNNNYFMQQLEIY